MISNNTIKYWFRGQLDSAGFDTTNDFAYGNRNFDSADKAVWYQERFTVVDEATNTNQSSSFKNGLMVYDVIVDRGAGDDTQDTSAEALADVFDPLDNKEVQIEPLLKIDIDEATTGVPVPLGESRFQLPVRMAFRAYQTVT
jgi:hypothetical protein